ncbi:MAG: TIGR03936 family radical SAM-associated protein [Acidimicrobiales bacterium]
MKVRLRFTKTGKVRFTSHRDVARMWERALRRADLPVAYSEGFSPRPKLSFGLALSTGHESMAEYLDVELSLKPESPDVVPIDVTEFPGLLSPLLPMGIDVVTAAKVEPGTPSLQESVSSCQWRIEAIGFDVSTTQQLVTAALAADELFVTRTRKGREVTDDLRPAIRSVSVVGPTGAGVELEAELDVHPRSVRPAELLSAVFPNGVEEGRVWRLAQWIWSDGARVEPLVVAASPDATLPPHALERV